jgi:hypothetical protein
MADEGWYIVKDEGGKTTQNGTHGYDNLRPDMHGIFIAHGPAFRHGYERLTIENIHLYNMMAELLSLKPAPNDGSRSAYQDLLQPEGRVSQGGLFSPLGPPTGGIERAKKSDGAGR